MENLPRRDGSDSGSPTGGEGIWAGKHKFSVPRVTLHLPSPAKLGGWKVGLWFSPRLALEKALAG